MGTPLRNAPLWPVVVTMDRLVTLRVHFSTRARGALFFGPSSRATEPAASAGVRCIGMARSGQLGRPRNDCTVRAMATRRARQNRPDPQIYPLWPRFKPL
jgi:hypothetical protein